MHSYSTHLDNIITRENETIEIINFEIQHAIETETNNILLAKQNSTETLST